MQYIFLAVIGDENGNIRQSSYLVWIQIRIILVNSNSHLNLKFVNKFFLLMTIVICISVAMASCNIFCASVLVIIKDISVFISNISWMISNQATPPQHWYTCRKIDKFFLIHEIDKIFFFLFTFKYIKWLVFEIKCIIFD
jgi:hypothetical protein